MEALVRNEYAWSTLVLKNIYFIPFLKFKEISGEEKINMKKIKNM